MRTPAASGGERPAPAGSDGHARAFTLRALAEIARRLAEGAPVDEILRTAVREATRALGADATVVRLLVGGRSEVVASAGVPHRDAAAAEPAAGARNVIRAPLASGVRTLGEIEATGRATRAWSPDDVEFLAAVAGQLSVAIRQAELSAGIDSREAQLGVLRAASARMSRATGIESVGRAIVEEIRRILDYHNARVYTIESPGRVVPIAFEGRVGAYEKVDLALLECAMGEGFTGWVAEHGVPLLVDDANADPRGEQITGTDDVEESMLVVPMRYDEVVVGVITLSKLGLGQFDDDDLRLLSILADQAATALESARLLARSESLARELRRLLDMSSALSESLDPRQVANLIAAHLAAAMGVDECAISYWDRGGEQLLTLGAFPAERVASLDPSFELRGYPETLRVLSDQCSVVVDVSDPDADPAEVELLRRDGNATLVMLPLVVKGESIGLVELMSKTPVRLDDARVSLARTMANEAAMALENARLYDDARKLADRDQLTGFYNHRYLHERLGAEVVRAQRSRRPLSLLMLDLDGFKLVNDTFGHLFGDRVLCWTADLIRDTLRASDIAARYGGDEFAIVLPETDAAAARDAGTRVLQALATRPFDAGTHGPVPVAASIGVATLPFDGRSATALIAAADRGLYRVKADGGNAVDAIARPVRAEESSVA